MAQEIRDLERSGPSADERRVSEEKRTTATLFRVSVAPIRWLGIGRWLGLALLALFVALRSWDPAPVETLRLRTFDLYQFIQPREAAVQPVAIVDLDEESLAEIGQWPWPRTQVADLVARIAGYGSVAMGFDSVFAEPDRMSPTMLADSLRSVSEGTRDELQKSSRCRQG